MDENKSCSGWAAQGYCTNSKYKVGYLNNMNYELYERGGDMIKK